MSRNYFPKLFFVLLISLAALPFAGQNIASFLSAQETEPSGVLLEGIVFEDLNRNSMREQNEPLLPGISVSDQIDVAVTDSKGSYKIENSNGYGIVFVSVPDGYSSVGTFWKRVPEEQTTHRIDFALQKRTRADTFTFIHASDTHLEEKSLPRIRRLREIVSSQNPDFVVITGDLVRDALRVDEKEATGYYELYVKEIALFPKPVWSVPGNHEIFAIERHLSLVSQKHPLYGKKMYRHYLGPDYYSFNYGGIHFIGLDTIDIDDLWYFGHVDDAQLEWLKRDLQNVPDSQSVVTFNHIPFLSAVEVMAGYRDTPPAPTLITYKEKTVFRHVVSNATEVITELRKHNFVLALGGHMHIRERLFYEMNGIKIRYEQSAATVGPSEGFGIELISGATLYKVRNGIIDEGTFLPLDDVKSEASSN